ncbi:hypothetical protein QJQ45_018796, partial [Haematococcus lacustris]
HPRGRAALQSLSSHLPGCGAGFALAAFPCPCLCPWWAGQAQLPAQLLAQLLAQPRYAWLEGECWALALRLLPVWLPGCCMGPVGVCGGSLQGTTSGPALVVLEARLPALPDAAAEVLTHARERLAQHRKLLHPPALDTPSRRLGPHVDDEAEDALIYYELSDDADDEADDNTEDAALQPCSYPMIERVTGAAARRSAEHGPTTACQSAGTGAVSHGPGSRGAAIEEVVEEEGMRRLVSSLRVVDASMGWASGPLPKIPPRRQLLAASATLAPPGTSPPTTRGASSSQAAEAQPTGPVGKSVLSHAFLKALATLVPSSAKAALLGQGATGLGGSSSSPGGSPLPSPPVQTHPVLTARPLLPGHGDRHGSPVRTALTSAAVGVLSQVHPVMPRGLTPERTSRSSRLSHSGALEAGIPGFRNMRHSSRPRGRLDGLCVNDHQLDCGDRTSATNGRREHTRHVTMDPLASASRTGRACVLEVPRETQLKRNSIQSVQPLGPALRNRASHSASQIQGLSKLDAPAATDVSLPLLRVNQLDKAEPGEAAGHALKEAPAVRSAVLLGQDAGFKRLVASLQRLQKAR